MTRPLLTIAIPTYNRQAKLLVTLQAILPQIQREGLELLVLDNASVPSVAEEIQGILPEHARLVRHAANIGLAGNLLRCFELAKGDWIWLLGDDDVPKDDAIQCILAEIARVADSTVLIKFNSTNGGQTSESRELNAPALASACCDRGFFSNLLFISSSVYRRRPMMDFIHCGYQFATSMAPHLAMLFAAQRHGSRVSLVPVELVKHGLAGEDNWNWFRLAMGIPLLAEAPGAETFAKVALPRLARSYLVSKSHWRLPFACIKSMHRGGGQRWRLYFLRLAGVSSPLWKIELVLCALFLAPILEWLARRCPDPALEARQTATLRS